VKQIIFNLLSNAVKFTPDGGTITVTSGRENSHVRVDVRDTGRGIAPEDRDRIFEEFRQARGGSDQGSEGTGLGLSLTKALVELHHGTISVESEVGQGSTFSFTLLGLDDSVPAGPLSGRVQVRITAPSASARQVREVVEWADRHCPVADGFRRQIPLALEIAI
jgi:anti-sigma regulatory factor (Ser/Thr protein kinase)